MNLQGQCEPNEFEGSDEVAETARFRIHPVQSGLVIYQVEDHGNILIVRVRHGREDWVDPLTEQ